MLKLKTLFQFLLALNCGGILTLLIFESSPDQSNPKPIVFQDKNPYGFHDPILAFQILKSLDIFEPVDNTYYDNLEKPTNLYHVPFMSLYHDENYCDIHRAYFVDDPYFIFRNLNFITDWNRGSLMRKKVGSVIGRDIQPNISGGIPAPYNASYIFSIKPNVNAFFINGPMHVYQQIGKSFSCLTQIYNHIPGHGTLNRKDMVAKSIVDYARKYKDKPQCFSFNKFFPRTWILDDPEQCHEFFKHFNGEEYQKLKQERKIVYIRKLGYGAHRALGIELVRDDE